MLTKQQFLARLSDTPTLLDGATGSNLIAAGMPMGCCSEAWILSHPEALVTLQRAYARAGSRILYAPTFQAQPIALERVGLANQTEAINAQLVALSRSAAPDCLIAGNLTTLAAFTDSADPANMDLLIENYARQIRGLIDGGADLLVAETLMYPQEAEAIFVALQLEGGGACLFSFVMQTDGSFLSGMDAVPVLQSLEEMGAAGLGFNCVAADSFTSGLVSRLHRSVQVPLICKPNAGLPYINEQKQAIYPMGPEEFAGILTDCVSAGARLVGGCCGTTPAHIAAVKAALCPNA